MKTGAIGSILLAVAVSAGAVLAFAQSPQSTPPQVAGGRGRGGAPTPEPPGFTRIKVVSSVDQSEQDAIVPTVAYLCDDHREFNERTMALVAARKARAAAVKAD